jgi:hypothetical protein
MTKHVGWLGLLISMALVPSACDGDDDTTGTGGSGNAPSAGTGGSSAGKGGSVGEAGGGGSTSVSGRGGSSGRGGTSGTGNDAGTGAAPDGSGGEDASGGAPETGGTTNAGAGGESAASGQAGAADQSSAGNGGEGGEAPTELLEIAGTWANTDFGETDVIGAGSWSQDYGTGPVVSAIVTFSNGQNYAIRQAPHDATFDPDKFDRTVWTEIDGDHFYYCTIDHGLDTAEEAEAMTTAVDANALDTTGCGGFPWTKLTAP